jgi:hypothetical protein
LKVLDKEIQLVVRNDHSVVSDLSLSFNGANVYFDVPKGFTSLLKTNGLIAQGPRSFEITVDRASLGHFFYQDKEKDFALRLNPNSLLYVKTISPNVVTLSGLGRLSGPGAPGGDGYSNFSATLEASTNGSATLTMEIPQLSYKQIEHTPPNAFIISREKDLYEVTDPKFTQKGVKTTAMTWP